jgi:hypothetical protein
MTLLYLLSGIVALELLVYLGTALLKMRCVLPSLVLALMIVVLPVRVFAQQTIFNVPSADVLDAGKVYLETDQYFRPWKTDSDDAAFFFMRGVVGVGANVELGLNAGPFDYIHQNNPFIVFAGKWRPVLLRWALPCVKGRGPFCPRGCSSSELRGAGRLWGNLRTASHSLGRLSELHG